MRGEFGFIVLAPAGVLLKAHYRQVPGTDPEYAQVAVEKNQLAHREVESMFWLPSAISYSPKAS